MPSNHPNLAATLFGLAAMLVLGCSDSSAPPTLPNAKEILGTGTIRVSITSVGSINSNGYTVDINGVPRRLVHTNGTVDITGVPAGDSAVGLGGLGQDCFTDEPNPQRVQVATGETLKVGFNVRCLAGPWDY